MSPARRASGRATGRPADGARRSRKRGSRRGLGIALALLGVVAAGASALALYFGFVPGPQSWFGRGAAPLAADSSTTATGALPGTPPADTAAAATAADSLAVASAAAAPAGPAGPATAADSAAGDAVYHGAGRCVGCHGAAGEGVAGLGPSLREGRIGDGSVASIARIVGGGAPPTAQYRIAMPAYGGQLAADDVARVAAYVFALAHPGSTAADTAPAPPSPADGAVNADASPTAATVPAASPAARPTRPTVPPPPAAAAPATTPRHP